MGAFRYIKLSSMSTPVSGSRRIVVFSGEGGYDTTTQA
jgi:hypothetical protein